MNDGDGSDPDGLQTPLPRVVPQQDVPDEPIKMTREEMIEVIFQMASNDEEYLYNEAIDISEVMDIVHARLRRMKKPELESKIRRAMRDYSDLWEEQAGGDNEEDGDDQ